MKRWILVLLILAFPVLAGCGTEQSTAGVSGYLSPTSSEDCCLCGNGLEDLIPSYCGQNNIALISLNTFEIKPIEINRYDSSSGRLIEEYAGMVSFDGGGSTDGGFSASLLSDPDRGYAVGSVDFLGDETPDADKAGSFLCTDCLNELLPEEPTRCFGVGVINLETRELRLFEKNLFGFDLGDFYIDCHLNEHGAPHQMDLLIVYCPIRYEPGP